MSCNIDETPSKKIKMTITATTASTCCRSDNVTYTCQLCGAMFESRNKLYRHVATCKLELESKSDCITSKSNIDADGKSDVYIYVIGGRVRGKTLRTVERFNFRLNIWEDKQFMNVNRGSHACTTIDCSTIYVVGGGGMQSNLNGGEVYDADNDKWTEMPPMKLARHAHSCCSISVRDRKEVYVVGGWIDGKECTKEVEMYDVNTNLWIQKGSLIEARKLFGSVSYKSNYLYAFGGNIDYGCTARVERYDVTLDKWSACSDLPFASSTSAVTIGNQIWIAVHGKYMLLYLPEHDRYIIKSNLPVKEWFCFDVTAYGSEVYLHGGTTQGHHCKLFYSYDTNSDTYKELPSMKSQRRRCSAGLVVAPAGL